MSQKDQNDKTQNYTASHELESHMHMQPDGSQTEPAATSETAHSPLDSTEKPHFRRMTHEDRLESYENQMEAYRKWKAEGGPGNVYKIPKHPDEEDREFEEAKERAKKSRNGSRLKIIGGHILYHG